MNDINTFSKHREEDYLLFFFSFLILLWCYGMNYISILDTIIGGEIILFFNIGFLRGGIKEFFGFFGAIGSIVLSLISYKSLSELVERIIGIYYEVIIEVVCFLCILCTGWVICYYLIYYFQQKIKKEDLLINTFNKIIGGSIGVLKGIILGYLFIIIIIATEISNINSKWEKQLNMSIAKKIVTKIEDKYKLLRAINNMKAIQKLKLIHKNIKVRRLIRNYIFPNNIIIQKKFIKLSFWFSNDLNNLKYLKYSKKAKKLWKKLLKNSKFRKFYKKNKKYLIELLIKKKKILKFYEFLKDKDFYKLVVKNNKSLIKLLETYNFFSIRKEIEKMIENKNKHR